MSSLVTVPSKRSCPGSEDTSRFTKKPASRARTSSRIGAVSRKQSSSAVRESKARAGRQKNGTILGTNPTTSAETFDNCRGTQDIGAAIAHTSHVTRDGHPDVDLECDDEIQPVRRSSEKNSKPTPPNALPSGGRPVTARVVPSQLAGTSIPSPGAGRTSPGVAPRPILALPAGVTAQLPTLPVAVPITGNPVPARAVAIGSQGLSGAPQNGGRLAKVLARTTSRIDGLHNDTSLMKKDMSVLNTDVRLVQSGMLAMTTMLESMNGKMTQMLETGGSKSTERRSTGSSVDNGVKPMMKYETIMLRRVPFHDIAFDPHVLSRCTISSLFAEIADRCGKELLDPAGLKSILDAVFFSLKRTDRKDVYSTTKGEAASALRRRILLNVLRQAHLDTFRRFRSHPLPTEDSNVVHSRGGVAAAEAGRPLKPTWLQHSPTLGTNYVTQAHLRIAQEHQESSAADKSSYQRRLRIAGGARPTRADDGEFLMSSLYSSLLTTLNASRRYGPLEFFQRLGYLFVDWNPHKNCRVSRDNMKMWWVADFKEARPCIIDDIPKAISVSAGDPDASEKNEDMYKSFVEEREEMQILVRHDVLVRLKGKEDDVRNHIGVDAREWTRVISLIDVAANFLRSACSFGRSGRCDDILTFSSKSIVALYNIAWVFRDMIASRKDPEVLPPQSTAVDVRNTDPDSESPSSDVSADIEALFTMLTPSASMIDRALVRVTCAVPEETFDTEQIDANDEGASPHTVVDVPRDDDDDNNGVTGANGNDFDDEEEYGDM